MPRSTRLRSPSGNLQKILYTTGQAFAPRRPYPIRREEEGLVGIEDPYYFSRLFKRVHGISPAGYRESGGA